MRTAKVQAIHKVAITPSDIRQRLYARALQIGKLPTGFDIRLIKLAPVEKHNRVHVISVFPHHVKAAKPGSACECGYATAAVDNPGIFAALIARRVGYLLEMDVHGQLCMFKYGIPDMASERTVTFDKTGKMQSHAITFRYLPKSRRSDAKRASVKKSQEKHGRKRVPTQRRSVWQTMRMSQPNDFAIAA